MDKYFRDDIEVNLNFEKFITVFGSKFLKPVKNLTLKARYEYNTTKPAHIKFTIYSDNYQLVFEKLEFLKEKDINVLSIIDSNIKEGEHHFPDIINFKDSQLIHIEPSYYYEHDKKPTILFIENMEVKTEQKLAWDGRFQLTDNVFPHINTYIKYGQLANYDSFDKFIFEDRNRETNFGLITFILSFKHSYGKYSKHKLEILRDAFLTITDNSFKLTNNQLLSYGETLCLLMSFYWEKKITYFIAQIRNNDKTSYNNIELFKFSKYLNNSNQTFILEEEFPTFYNFVEGISYSNIVNHYDIIKSITSRYIDSKLLDPSSEFMILYNVIEEIRTYHSSNNSNNSNNSNIEEYNFDLSKTKTNNFIKEKIKSISAILKKDDRTEFIDNANGKVSFIKKKSLTNQINNFLLLLKLDPLVYKIDISQLIGIRNKIYHGNSPSDNIKEINKTMRKIIYDIVLKLIVK